MSRSTLAAAVLGAAALVAPSDALAAQDPDQASLCAKAYGARMRVIHLHGDRAPGRNICRWGVLRRHGKQAKQPRSATTGEKVRYLKQLRRLLAPPPPYLVRTAVPPSQPPAGTLSAGTAPSGILDAIARCESGGSYNAYNPSGARGRYQMMPGTYQSAVNAGAADGSWSPADQDRAAAWLLRTQGTAPWSASRSCWG